MSDEIDMISKDLFGVCSRLFNHRAVLNAESRYLVKELETKKNKDSPKVFAEIGQTIEKVKALIPECGQLLNDKTQHIHSEVVKAASSGLDILDDSNNADHEKIRAELRTVRQQEWEDFLVEMNKAQSDVLQKHEQRMAELHSKLEVKN